jgi:hypothetical protein
MPNYLMSYEDFVSLLGTFENEIISFVQDYEKRFGTKIFTCNDSYEFIIPIIPYSTEDYFGPNSDKDYIGPSCPPYSSEDFIDNQSSL